MVQENYYHGLALAVKKCAGRTLSEITSDRKLVSGAIEGDQGPKTAFHHRDECLHPSQKSSSEWII